MGSKRHLRIYRFDDYGHEIDPRPFSTAIMPATRMPFNRRLRAKDYCRVEHTLRRELAARLALQEARRPRPLFWGIFIVVCPDLARAAYRTKRAKTPGLSAKLTPATSYRGSYAAISPLGKVVVGDVAGARLKQVVTNATALIREIMTRKPGEPDKRFLLGP